MCSGPYVRGKRSGRVVRQQACGVVPTCMRNRHVMRSCMRTCTACRRNSWSRGRRRSISSWVERIHVGTVHKEEKLLPLLQLHVVERGRCWQGVQVGARRWGASRRWGAAVRADSTVGQVRAFRRPGTGHVLGIHGSKQKCMSWEIEKRK
jgi:hypothetical protein